MSTLKFRLVCNCDNKTLPVAKRNVQVATTYNIQEGLRYGRAGLSIFVATPPSCKISSDGNYFKSLYTVQRNFSQRSGMIPALHKASRIHLASFIRLKIWQEIQYELLVLSYPYHRQHGQTPTTPGLSIVTATRACPT